MSQSFTKIKPTVTGLLRHVVIAPKPMSGLGIELGTDPNTWPFKGDIIGVSRVSLLPRTVENVNAAENVDLNFSKSTTLTEAEGITEKL